MRRYSGEPRRWGSGLPRREELARRVLTARERSARQTFTKEEGHGKAQRIQRGGA